MNKLLSVFFVLCLVAFFSCEDDKPVEKRFLEGTYALNSLSEYKVYETANDVTLNLANTSDSVTTVTLEEGDTIGIVTNLFTSGVDGVQGTAVLKNDLSALLEGSLFTNIGSLCDPLVILATFASEGSWSVSETDYTFELNLETDALDIQGTFTFDEENGFLTIYYTTVNELDSLKISRVDHNGSTRDIDEICVPVVSTTDRIMSFILEDQ